MLKSLQRYYTLAKEYVSDGTRNFEISKKGKFLKNCGAASVGVLQDNLVLSTGLIM